MPDVGILQSILPSFAVRLRHSFASDWSYRVRVYVPAAKSFINAMIWTAAVMLIFRYRLVALSSSEIETSSWFRISPVSARLSIRKKVDPVSVKPRASLVGW